MSSLRGRLLLSLCPFFLLSPAVRGAPLEGTGKPKPRLDRHGDPLPDAAVARLGTARWRYDPKPPGGCGLYDGRCFVVLSPDGAAVAVMLLERGPIRLWDTATGKLLREFPRAVEGSNSGYGFSRLLFSANGKRLIAGNGADFCVWDVGTGRVLRSFSRDGGGIGRLIGLTLCHDGKTLAAAEREEVRWWDLTTGKLIRKWDPSEGKRGEIKKKGDRIETRAVPSPDGRTVAAEVRVWRERRPQDPPGEESVVVKVVEAARGKELWRFETDWETTNHLTFSADGKLMACNHGKNVLALREAGTGKAVRQWEFPDGKLCDLAFSGDGRTLASSHEGNSVCLWDVGTGKLKRRLEADRAKKRVNGFVFLSLSADGNTAAAGDWQTFRVWDAEAGKELPGFEGHRDAVESVAFSRDGRLLCSASAERCCYWDTAGWKERRRVPMAGVRRGQPLAASPVNDRLIRYGPGGALRLCEMATGKVVHTFPGAKEGLKAGVFSPDGGVVVLRGEEEGKPALLFFDTATGKQLGRWRDCPTLYRLQVTGGGVLAGVDGRGVIMVWDVTTRRVRRLGRPAAVTQFDPESHELVFALSPGGEYVATAAYGEETAGVPRKADDLRVRLWDAASGKLVRPCGEATERVTCLAFSADGRSLAVGYYFPHVIRLWEVASGRPRAKIESGLWPRVVEDPRDLLMDQERGPTGHRGIVRSLAFSPDGRLLASGGEDGTVMVWELSKRHGRRREGRLSDKELAALWDALAEGEAGKAFEAVCALREAPGQAVALLREKLRPVRAAQPECVRRLIADLDSPHFAARQAATEQLERLEEAAAGELRKALHGEPSLELRRRVELLLRRLDERALSPDGLRQLRAVEALEGIGTAEAAAVLKELAEGMPQARLTRAAKAALKRQEAKPR